MAHGHPTPGVALSPERSDLCFAGGGGEGWAFSGRALRQRRARYTGACRRRGQGAGHPYSPQTPGPRAHRAPHREGKRAHAALESRSSPNVWTSGRAFSKTLSNVCNVPKWGVHCRRCCGILILLGFHLKWELVSSGNIDWLIIIWDKQTNFVSLL